MCEKSDAVVWISVEITNKRKPRIKKFKAIKKLVETAPDSCELFKSNLVDTYYPQHPDNLKVLLVGL